MQSEAFNLRGRRAVVTGSSSGLGAAIALGLARAGANIVGVSRDEAGQRATAEAVTALGRRYEAHTTNLAVRSRVRALAADLVGNGDPVDILVNNAGIISRGPAEYYADDAWDEVLEVDVTAGFILSRELGRSMLDRGAGKVVFVASLQSFQAGHQMIGYSTAKSALIGLVRGLANEWAGRGVNVNAIAPGYIDTDMTRARQADPAGREAVINRTPAGRWGRPEDVAGAAVFLCSPASDFVHGIVLPVDGGWLVR